MLSCAASEMSSYFSLVLVSLLPPQVYQVIALLFVFLTYKDNVGFWSKHDIDREFPVYYCNCNIVATYLFYLFNVCLGDNLNGADYFCKFGLI